MLRIFGFVVSLLSSMTTLADCSYAILKQNLQTKQIDGETYLVVPQKLVSTQCIDIEALANDLDTLNQYKSLLAEYKQHDDSMADSIVDFRKLLAGYGQTSQDLLQLTARYDEHVSQYDKLSRDFNDLLIDYNELVKKYRSIALNQSSSLSFDIGAGLSEDGNVSGLMGVGYEKIRVWGVYQNGQSALMLGTRITF